MIPKTGIEYSKIEKLFRSVGINLVWFMDEKYVIPGNFDNEYIRHSDFVAAFADYSSELHKRLLQYESEVFDCDDFAWMFKAFCHIHKINGCGFAVGKLYWGDQFCGWHAFNIVPYALTPNNFIVLLIEPQVAPLDGITSYNHGAKLWNYRYEVVEVIM